MCSFPGYSSFPTLPLRIFGLGPKKSYLCSHTFRWQTSTETKRSILIFPLNTCLSTKVVSLYPNVGKLCCVNFSSTSFKILAIFSTRLELFCFIWQPFVVSAGFIVTRICCNQLMLCVDCCRDVGYEEFEMPAHKNLQDVQPTLGLVN